MTVTCCGDSVRTIDIAIPSGRLTMGYCARCDQGRWFHNAAEIPLHEVLDVAALTWNKTRRLAA